MDKIMLNCDQATLLATQNSVDKIGCVKKIQLNLHLMGCKLCRTFVKQTNQITYELKKEAEMDADNLKLQLTVARKQKMKTEMEKG